MKKGSIKGLDGSELEAYFPYTHLNNLNELDVNENSAGCGAHEEAMVKAFEELGGSVKKKCCGGGCHDGDKAEFPTTLSWDAPKEMIKDFVKKAKEAHQEEKSGQGTAGFVAPYDYPLDKAFDYGYNVEVDPINKLFNMFSKAPAPNKTKVKIDDTIESDLLETKDLRLGRLYRVAGMNLVVRFVAQIMDANEMGPQKTLLQIKHHGIILYVEEKQLVKASREDVREYLLLSPPIGEL